MALADFAYDTPQRDAGRPSVLIVSDRLAFRADLATDAAEAGYGVREPASLQDLVDAGTIPEADIVLVEFRQTALAAAVWLAKVDTQLARRGGQLILNCSPASLDDAFSYCDQSCPQFLVECSRADAAFALGVATMARSGSRVRERDDENTVLLLRLVDQVSRLASRLDALSQSEAHGGEEPFLVQSLSATASLSITEKPSTPSQMTRPPLPDPRLVRSIIRQRQARSRFFDGELFADPAWDMLLDLTAARAEHRRVSVTSLCIASSVPPTTALRWIAQLVAVGLFARIEDDADRRRAFIALTDRASDAMARYFAEIQMMDGRAL